MQRDAAAPGDHRIASAREIGLNAGVAAQMSAVDVGEVVVVIVDSEFSADRFLKRFGIVFDLLEATLAIGQVDVSGEIRVA